MQNDWNDYSRGRGWQKSDLCLSLNLLIISLTFKMNVIIFFKFFGLVICPCYQEFSLSVNIIVTVPCYRCFRHPNLFFTISMAYSINNKIERAATLMYYCVYKYDIISYYIIYVLTLFFLATFGDGLSEFNGLQIVAQIQENQQFSLLIITYLRSF